MVDVVSASNRSLKEFHFAGMWQMFLAVRLAVGKAIG